MLGCWDLMDYEVGKEETQFLFDLAKREYLFHPSVERDPSKFEFKKTEE